MFRRGTVRQNQSPWVDLLWLLELARAADRHRHRLCTGSLARRDEPRASRSRGAGHGRDLATGCFAATGQPAGSRARTNRRCSSRLQSRLGLGADAFCVASRSCLPSFLAGFRLRRAGLRPRAGACGIARPDSTGALALCVHGAIRVAERGRRGSMRRCSFVDDAQLATGCCATLVLRGPSWRWYTILGAGRGGTRRDHKRRGISAAVLVLIPFADPAQQREMAAAQGIGWRCALASACSAFHFAAVSIWLVPMPFRRQQRSVARCLPRRESLFQPDRQEAPRQRLAPSRRPF